jgi:hypothetical protein
MPQDKMSQPIDECGEEHRPKFSIQPRVLIITLEGTLNMRQET